MQPARSEPVAQLVIVRGNREDHAHVEGLAVGAVALDHRRQRLGRDRVLRQAVGVLGDVRLHLRPDFVRHGDAVAVQVHREGRDDMRLGAVADRGGQRLPGEHVGAVELSVDHPVEQHLPVGLRLERDEQPLLEEVALLVGHRERRHVGQLDEAEGQLVLFQIEHLRSARRGERRRRDEAEDQSFHVQSLSSGRGRGRPNTQKAADTLREGREGSSGFAQMARSFGGCVTTGHAACRHVLRAAGRSRRKVLIRS